MEFRESFSLIMFLSTTFNVLTNEKIVKGEYVVKISNEVPSSFIETNMFQLLENAFGGEVISSVKKPYHKMEYFWLNLVRIFRLSLLQKIMMKFDQSHRAELYLRI